MFIGIPMNKSVNMSICVNWCQGMVGVPWKPLLPLALTDVECINNVGLKQKPFVCLKNMCKHTYNCDGGSLRSIRIVFQEAIWVVF